MSCKFFSHDRYTHVDAKQLELDGFENFPAGDPQTASIAAHSPRKPENKGKESIVLPSDLPVETIIIDTVLPVALLTISRQLNFSGLGLQWILNASP